MLKQLRQICKELLEEGKVNAVIGYGQDAPGKPAYPIFVTQPADVTQLVWNSHCYNNLAVYLTQKRIRALYPKVAIIVKGCDARAVTVLDKDSQISREDVVVIGMACEGVGEPREPKCNACDVHMPHNVDITVGEVPNPPVTQEQRFAELNAFLKKTPEERMAYWKTELARCVKCYACRQTCPLCYCERCIVDKNRPTCIDTSATLKGNFAWQITRAFHQAARCVGCDECTRVCPAGINLRLLNQSLALAAENCFEFRAGMDAELEPVVGAYSLQDKENFIR
ncbi:MAG TPA: Fe-S oxidoreductase [Candidatus Sumerlaeota bacterium]|nr:Fe-S oxidoreductase [Candidatus Sumerlaeota bacterium]HPS02286.1 Fe-S oxidoreductase [Candidatus Sumerlaeota bacterium]